MNKRLVLASVLSLALGRKALACSLCGCGDPMESAGFSPPRAGQWRLGLEQERLSQRAAGEEDPASRDALTQNSSRLSLAYSPSNRLNLLLKLPWVQKSWSNYGGGEEPEKGSSSGLGDLDLGARWFFAVDTDVQLRRLRYAALTLGSSLNSGANNLTQDGHRLDEHLQPGTGALGPYAGVFLGWESGDWSLASHIDWHMFSTNSYGYTYGSALKAGLRLRRDTSAVTAVTIGLEGRYADMDHAGAEAVPNTGGTLVHLVPGLHLRLGMATALSLQAQLPLLSNLFGYQQVDPVYSASLQFLWD